jgi:hypothetical protein
MQMLPIERLQTAAVQLPRLDRVLWGAKGCST